MATTVYTGAVAVTPSDTARVSKTTGIYVGGAGNLAVVMGGEGAAAAGVVFQAVQVGEVLPISVIKVLATGTTATNIIALR